MDYPRVTKTYVEELGEQDADGLYDYAYRYWDYRFDFGDRAYRARTYVDTPTEAGVVQLEATRHPEYESDMRAIASYLDREASVTGIKTLESGGYEPWPKA